MKIHTSIKIFTFFIIILGTGLVGFYIKSYSQHQLNNPNTESLVDKIKKGEIISTLKCISVHNDAEEYYYDCLYPRKNHQFTMKKNILCHPLLSHGFTITQADEMKDKYFAIQSVKANANDQSVKIQIDSVAHTLKALPKFGEVDLPPLNIITEDDNVIIAFGKKYANIEQDIYVPSSFKRMSPAQERSEDIYQMDVYQTVTIFKKTGMAMISGSSSGGMGNKRPAGNDAIGTEYYWCE